jgi:uncharacterized membrane protein YbhN (UPF0104 family)
MQWENLYYALNQVIHNFGALTVVGGALFALRANPDQQDLKHKLAWLVLIAWGAQGVSGLVFGGISLYFYGETPDLHSVAMLALTVKMLCAGCGFLLALVYLLKAKQWRETRRQRAWLALTGLGVIALTAAAFLRWFS